MNLKETYNKNTKNLKLLFLFIIAFIPRIWGLGTILTVDEPLWIWRSSNFIQAIYNFEFQKTLITTHPGVTTMWTSGISIWIKKAIGNGKLADLLFAAKLPTAVITSLSVVLIYLFLNKIFDEKTALIGALLIAFDPFFIAHSRIIHLDAFLTVFMTLSILSFITFLKLQKKYYLYVSGALAGLAFLTKLPGFLLIPFVFFTLRTGYVTEAGKRENKVFLKWLAIAMLTCLILWPALWVNPVKATNSLFQNAVGVITTPHAGSNFFMGKITPDPGYLFYLTVLLLRLTPVVLISSLICLFFLKNMPKNERETILTILFFIFFFILIVSITAKKGDRYLLPIFPLIDILAAVGATHVAEKFSKDKMSLKIGIFSLLILLQVLSAVPLNPYYLTYYSPIIGSSKTQNIMTVGWGEGLEKSADYLNQKNQGDIIVSSFYPQVFRTYYDGDVIDINDAPIFHKKIDYYVFYINQIQREPYFKDFIKTYTTGSPEHTVKINGIPYVTIYKGKK